MDKHGKISLCPHMGCAFKCCTFQQGNYIVTYPGEYEKALEDKLSVRHLAVIDEDYNGGKRMVCKAKDTSNCDKGFKPLDCQSYPFFPTADPDGEAGKVNTLIKGEKCPLTSDLLDNHRNKTLNAWQEVAARPEVFEWLTKVELVGYVKEEIPVGEHHDLES